MERARDVPVPVELDACCALLEYEGEARQLVTAMKYRNDRRMLAWLAAGMAGLMTPPPGCVVTWAPTSSSRRRRRGFDQAELLARAVARRWRVPCRRLLERAAGPAQTGRSRADRLRGGVFMVRRRKPLAVPVVVVDDVLTTGATLCSAAGALRAAGASWVGAVTAARVP